MYVCTDPALQNWSPDFSTSGQASPTWVRLFCNQRVIANAMNWSEWLENPVQVVLCDACGHIGCASGGNVHVSRIGPYIVWTAPQEGWSDDRTQWNPAHFLERVGAAALSESVWQQWSSSVEELPRAERFPPANGRALADAWVLGPGRPLELSTLDAFLRERLIGGDTLAKSRIIEIVSMNLDCLLSPAGELPDYRVVGAAESGARIENLYFDGPAEQDWPALAFVGETISLALNRDLVLTRE